MIVNSNIKGYHTFKIRPHPQIEMITEEEIGNPRDPHAVVIKMPSLNEISEKFHEGITKKKRGKEKQQTVKDIAGAVIGIVLANICKLFEKLITDGDVTSIACIAVIDPEQSKIPPSRQSFKNKLNEYDRRGGGVAVPCKIKLVCHDPALPSERIKSIKLSRKRDFIRKYRPSFTTLLPMVNIQLYTLYILYSMTCVT